MNNSMGSRKYKPVCYETLRALVEAKKLSSVHIQEKILRTHQAAQISKESSLLRQHRQAWSGEHSRLSTNRKKAETELQAYLQQDGTDEDLLPQLFDYELLLKRERELFRRATVDPIWQLRDDLHDRMSEVKQGCWQQPPQAQEWNLIWQQVQSVKKQQEAVQKKLYSEYVQLEEEMSALGIEEHLSASLEVPDDMARVPVEILHSECPYPDLKASLIQEFQSLSMKYRSRLENVELDLRDVDRCCGWIPEDHLVFEVTLSQYPPNMNNHRALYMDMVQRLLPHKSRHELHDHECSWDRYRYALAQRRALIQSWRQDRASLLDVILTTLQEARLNHQRELVTRSDRAKREESCIQLKEKLLLWREQREEMSHLEEAVEAKRHQEEQERLRSQQEQENSRRASEKERIREYYSKKHRRREELEETAKQKLVELRTLMTEQAKRDKERVQFREGILQWRREEREAQVLLQLRQQEERNQRLESLRKEVAVFVETDRERMMKDTQASKNRCRTAVEEFVLQKPLFHLHTYTDKQIASDPRLRTEWALREAGLHDTPYAQEVLSGIQPKRPPRRDTESTGFRF